MNKIHMKWCAKGKCVWITLASRSLIKNIHSIWYNKQFASQSNIPLVYNIHILIKFKYYLEVSK